MPGSVRVGGAVAGTTAGFEFELVEVELHASAMEHRAQHNTMKHPHPFRPRMHDLRDEAYCA
jgi:hypothetical protein